MPAKYTNHYDGENPLGIVPDLAKRSNNYFLIIGDWGKDDGGKPGDCMWDVAKKMKAYTTKQKGAGKTLLFIATVGDNFYINGLDPHTSWRKQWAEPYGTNDPASPLYNIPWLSVLGNHDLGNKDPHALCPYKFPQAFVDGQPYAGKQFNADRNPTRPPNGSTNTTHYWLPDFNYHYAIPKLSLEIIAIDRNLHDVKGWPIAAATKAQCGASATKKWLEMVDDAGEDLLRTRAKISTATSTVIIQHYPGQCARGVFEGALPKNRTVQTLCAWGHTHDQKGENKDATGVWSDILTGGGGGCCGNNYGSKGGSLPGFTAVTLDNAGGFTVDIESADVRQKAHTCSW